MNLNNFCLWSSLITMTNFNVMHNFSGKSRTSHPLGPTMLTFMYLLANIF